MFYNSQNLFSFSHNFLFFFYCLFFSISFRIATYLRARSTSHHITSHRIASHPIFHDVNSFSTVEHGIFQMNLSNGKTTTNSTNGTQIHTFHMTFRRSISHSSFFVHHFSFFVESHDGTKCSHDNYNDNANDNGNGNGNGK